MIVLMLTLIADTFDRLPKSFAFCKPYHGDLYTAAVIFRPMKRIILAVTHLFLLLPLLGAAENAAVPAYVLELPRSVSEVLIADTKSATLHRFELSGSGIVDVEQRYMSIGQNGVGKKRAWDRKTPLGVYFITEQLDTSKLNAKYGVAAFPLDYPNAWDQRNDRTGNGIWLHGVDANGSRRPPRDTNGCLALPNDELLSLADSLEPLVTPVIVARELVWATADELENIRAEFHIALDMWRQSLEANDLETYLSLYSHDFRRHGMDKAKWSSYRKGTFDPRDLESVRLDDLLLLSDPEVPGLYLSRFTLEFVSDGGTARTTTRLYWQRQQDKVWKIVAEGAG